MIIRMVKVAGMVAFASLCLTGCADQMVTLRYTADPPIERLSTTRDVTVYKFADRRGDEGDHGDPLRVGGVYNGYGMRYAKIMTLTPWPEIVAQDLVAAFSARGVQAVAVVAREYAPGTALGSTPLILSGEIRNFSTEAKRDHPLCLRLQRGGRWGVSVRVWVLCRDAGAQDEATAAGGC